MKHIIATSVVILVIVTGIVMYKVDFHFGNFNEETKTLYALFLGIICTQIIVTAMAMIYKKRTEPTNKEVLTQEEDMNEVYRHRDTLPMGCLMFVIAFVGVLAYSLYVSINYRF